MDSYSTYSQKTQWERKKCIKWGQTQLSAWLQIVRTSQHFCSLPSTPLIAPKSHLGQELRLCSTWRRALVTGWWNSVLPVRFEVLRVQKKKKNYRAAGQKKVLKRAIKSRRETWKTFSKILINRKSLRTERHHKSKLYRSLIKVCCIISCRRMEVVIVCKHTQKITWVCFQR